MFIVIFESGKSFRGSPRTFERHIEIIRKQYNGERLIKGRSIFKFETKKPLYELRDLAIEHNVKDFIVYELRRRWSFLNFIPKKEPEFYINQQEKPKEDTIYVHPNGKELSQKEFDKWVDEKVKNFAHWGKRDKLEVRLG